MKSSSKKCGSRAKAARVVLRREISRLHQRSIVRTEKVHAEFYRRWKTAPIKRPESTPVSIGSQSFAQTIEDSRWVLRNALCDAVQSHDEKESRLLFETLMSSIEYPHMTTQACLNKAFTLHPLICHMLEIAEIMLRRFPLYREPITVMQKLGNIAQKIEPKHWLKRKKTHNLSEITCLTIKVLAADDREKALEYVRSFCGFENNILVLEQVYPLLEGEAKEEILDRIIRTALLKAQLPSSEILNDHFVRQDAVPSPSALADCLWHSPDVLKECARREPSAQVAKLLVAHGTDDESLRLALKADPAEALSLCADALEMSRWKSEYAWRQLARAIANVQVCPWSDRWRVWNCGLWKRDPPPCPRSAFPTALALLRKVTPPQPDAIDRFAAILQQQDTD